MALVQNSGNRLGQLMRPMTFFVACFLSLSAVAQASSLPDAELQYSPSLSTAAEKIALEASTLKLLNGIAFVLKENEGGFLRMPQLNSISNFYLLMSKAQRASLPQGLRDFLTFNQENGLTDDENVVSQLNEAIPQVKSDLSNEIHRRISVLQQLVLNLKAE